MSHTAHYGSDERAWERFLTELKSLPPEMSVLGINDYLWVDGYKRVREAHRAGELPNIETVFPVIELRLNDFVGTEGKLQRVNAHVIFKPDTPPKIIEQQFIHRLVASFQLSPQYQDLDIKWDEVCTREAIEDLGRKLKASIPPEELPKYGSDFKEGFNNWVIPLDKIVEACTKSSAFAEKPLLALGKTEWGDIRWNDNAIAAKKNLINQADLIFTAASDPASFRKALEGLQKDKVNDRLLDCSDAHHFTDSKDKDRLGNCFTWICADPTLAGLKHALQEYHTRVFVGSKPHLLVKQNSDPTNFFSNVAIRPMNDHEQPAPGFDIELPLNAGFVAVIGNKGSGKSALLDSIALAANSQAEQDFTFLRKERFRNPRNNKAKFYQVTVQTSGEESIGPKKLSSPVDRESAERVRYLPQSVLENLCDSEPDSPDDVFEAELRSIIFSHVPQHQRLGCTSLDELIRQRSSSLETEIKHERSRLSETNSLIVEFEEKHRPSRIASLKAKLAAVKNQLERHEATRPPDPILPEAPAEDEEDPILTQLTTAKEELANIEEQLAAWGGEYSAEQLRLNALVNLNREIETFRSAFNDFQSRVRSMAEDAGFRLDELISLHVKTEPIDTSRIQSAEKLQRLEETLSPNSAMSQRRIAVRAQIESLEYALSEPQRRYEQQRAELEAWQAAKDQLIGDQTIDGTLYYFETQLEEAKQLADRLQTLRTERLKISSKIHTLLLEHVHIFKEYYAPVQSFLDRNELARDHFSLQFQAGLEFRDFATRFLTYLNKNVSGSFYAVEASEQRVGKYVETTSPVEWASLEAFLNAIDQDLRADRRNVNHPTEMDCAADALRKGVTLQEVYDFLFGLHYIEAQFELQSENRPISELSPGQKGTILLMFYLLVDKSGKPIILDQPDEHLDNQTVYKLLRPAISAAKSNRQVLVVTHSPNLAVVGDADQVIVAFCDGAKFSYTSGAIEDPTIRDLVVDVLEGTWPAFENRLDKYESLPRPA